MKRIESIGAKLTVYLAMVRVHSSFVMNGVLPLISIVVLHNATRNSFVYARRSVTVLVHARLASNSYRFFTITETKYIDYYNQRWWCWKTSYKFSTRMSDPSFPSFSLSDVHKVKLSRKSCMIRVESL